jgi:hypothetical protein
MRKAILLAFALATPLLPQSSRTVMGSISGSVFVGAARLPGATVTVRFDRQVHTLVTAGEGDFVDDAIPLGAVAEISVEYEGLKTQKRTVTLTSDAASQDFTFAMEAADLPNIGCGVPRGDD